MDDLCQVGNTKEIEIEGIVFKREDENFSGSVKDRGISYQLNWAKKEGVKNLVISSSGNTAISACWLAKRLGLNLFVFLSPKIHRGKLAIIQEFPFHLSFSNRPVSDSIKFAQKNNFYHLRASIDPRGSTGYQQIAKEILENRVNQGIDSIFIPVSSGTTLVGIFDGFQITSFIPQIHAVQSSAVFPIAAQFDKDFTAVKRSLADALVAKFTPRRKQVIDIIKRTRGSGWVVSDETIEKANRWFEKRGIATSPEGAAALAGIWKAKEKKWPLGERIVCLLTGKRFCNHLTINLCFQY